MVIKIYVWFYTSPCTIYFSADCSAGQYYDSIVEQCLQCNFGTYQPEAYQYECEICPQGTTTEIQGSSQLTDCVGMYKFVNSCFQSKIIKVMGLNPSTSVEICIFV